MSTYVRDCSYVSWMNRFNNLSIDPSTLSLIYSFTHLFTQSPNHPFTHSPIHSFTNSPCHSLTTITTHSPNAPPVHHPFTHPFTLSPCHSFTIHPTHHLPSKRANSSRTKETTSPRHTRMSADSVHSCHVMHTCNKYRRIPMRVGGLVGWWVENRCGIFLLSFLLRIVM